MWKMLAVLAFAALLPGVCTAGPLIVRTDCVAEPRQFADFYLAKSPFVFPRRDAPSRPPRSEDQVEAYYIKFNFFNAPTNVDVSKFYVIAPASKPAYKVRKIARIEVYLPALDDALGVAELKRAAAKLGADAVVEVMRAPCLDPHVVGTRRGFWSDTNTYKASGYGYWAEAVIRK